MTIRMTLQEAADQNDRAIEEAAKEKLTKVEKEIAWNERRLTNLVWGDDDRQQTEDFIADLRQERQWLLAVLNTK